MLLDPESESVNEARDGLKPFIIGHTSPDGLVVSNELKEIMEKSGLLEMVFKPVLSKYNPDHGPISGCWELTTDFLLPPLSNPELDDGFYTPPEFRYRSAGIKAALPFDIGRCREYGNIIVSGRFYRFCAEQKLDMTWQPVRIDPD